MKTSRFRLKQSAIIAASIHLIFSDTAAWANPTGAQVVNGIVSMQRPNASTLNITNSPGAIINWQGFSIGASELTRFIQQSSSSAILNRVVGADISQIHGQLLSNGRVFLINPAGIVIGPGAIVDTAGFVASTLNMLDGDFLAGKLKFQGDANSGSIVNQGWIRTGYGGQVVLVAPTIENSGLIHTPGGELILAAGRSLTISSLDLEGVQFEVQAPTDSVLNVGKLLADGGAVGVFAGTLKHSGEIRANALVYDEAGRVVLKAQNEIQLAAGSTTSADGRIGGDITLQSAGGLTRVAGTVSAQGSAGQGGDVKVLGDRVAIVESAVLNASGTAGGGQILVGGDFQGSNASVQNSSNTFVGSGANLRADATQSGDGGRIIVWSDDKTQFYGNLSAQSGPDGGNGGFAEVSGKQNLIFAGGADLGAAKGSLGNLLLDPLDLYVFTGGGILYDTVNDLSESPSNAATVSPATLAAVTGNVSLNASRYMRISDPITLTTPGQSLTATVGTYTAPVLPDPQALSTGTIFNELEIGANITTAGGAVSLSAPTIQSVGTSLISTGGGAISLNTSGSTINASQLSLDAGSGAVTAISGSSIQLNSVSGGSYTATAPSFISTSAITTGGGPVTLTSTGSFISTGAISSGGGGVTLDSASSSNTGNVTAGGGNVSLTGDGGVFASIIDTSGSVVLNASGGSISSTVNNASSLTANAAFSAFISSATDLNIDTVTAGSFGTASLSTSNGSIRGTSSTAQVKGLDVSLLTAANTGGGIGTATTALNVDAQRNFTFRPNGDFNILLTGSGPIGLNAQLTPANTGQTYSGSLTKQGGGLTLNASANDTTVTLNTLSITGGFDQQVFFSNPFITIQTTGNADLIANSVTVPTGDTVSTIPFPNGVPLNVSLFSGGDLTLNNYTRTAGGLPKFTTISASGTVTLGNVDASKDTVSVTGFAGINVSSLVSTGNVTLNAGSGAVQAQTNSPGLEISSGGVLSITAPTIGTTGFANPLDLAGAAIILTSQNTTGGKIGFAGAPVIANTQDLTITAANPSSFNVATTAGATFNVSTGSTSLTNLAVTANPLAVGDAGVAQVSTASGGAVYVFDADASGDFTFNPPASTGRNVSFRSISGDISLGTANLGTGNLVVTANSGSILGGSSLTAANVTLTAQQFSSANSNVDVGAVSATDASGSITLKGNTSVTTGNLNAASGITIAPSSAFFLPDVTVTGAIGGTTAPTTVSITGDVVTTTGAVTGAGNVTLDASGLLTVGGAITGGNGSTIALESGGATPFSFNSIDAGITGTVIINSANGITQQAGGAGIRARTIELYASNGDIVGLDTLPGGDHLDLLNGTNSLNLTVDAGGTALLNANGNALSSLTVTKRTIPDVDSFDISNLGGSQSIAIGGGASEAEIEVNSPTALNFTMTYTTGDNIKLVGGGIATGGGAVSLTSSGGIDATTGGIASGGGTVSLTAGTSLDTSGTTITSAGGAVTLISNSGDITGGAITSSGGSILARTFGAGGNISLGGNLDAGAGSITLQAFGGGNIAGAGTLTSSSSVTASTVDGVIGTPAGLGPAVPLAIASPTVSLTANRGVSATGEEGTVLATLTGTNNLGLTGDRGFSVTSDTAFATLSVATKGTGAGTLSLTAGGGQTYSFARPATDLFGANVANTAFEVMSVDAPTATATFTASDGILLVRGTPGGANKINVQNLTLSSAGGGDIVLQGKASDPLTLSNTTQTFGASGGATADLLIRGTAALTATSSQTLSATGNINVNADAGGSGNVTISAPTQQFTTTGSASKMEFLGGAAAGEKVTVTATSTQRVDATSSSVDSFKLKGGGGTDASVTFTHSGTGVQDFQMLAGTVTVEGGSGSNAYAKLEETGVNLQRICRFVIFQGCVPVGGLQILGGSGVGAYGQVTSLGSQDVGVSGATLVKGGTGDGAYALLQAGTTQNIFGGGSLTVEGQGGAGAVGKAEVLASGFQSISAGSVAVKAGMSNGSLARIATTGSQSIFGSSLTLTANGTEAAPLSGASAVVEGTSQSISVGAITLTGGSGTDGSNTSDAVLRNLSGNQFVSASSVTMNGGHQFSTTGILNSAAGGNQTISASGGVTMTSDPDAHPDASVLIQNLAATAQTITASSGGIRLNSGGAGTVGITSAASQEIRSRYLEVLTTPGTTMNGGTAQVSAATDQRIHTTADSPANALLGNTINSLAVAALGTGMAKIEAGGAQLLEVGYPEMMQTTGLTGVLRIGDTTALGTSRISATNQSVFAGSLVIQGGSTTDSISKLGAATTQTVSTLLGGVALMGGSGSNADALIDPSTQTILANGPIDLTAGSGPGADAAILNTGSPPGPQTIVSTNGDITLTGGTAPGASAIINTLGPASAQTVAASGSIVLTQGSATNALASITNAGAGPTVTTLTTLVAQAETDQVNTLNEYQSQVIAELPPEEDELRTRVPICR